MEWGSLVEKAKEGGFSTTVLPENDYEVVITGSKFRKSGQNPQLIVNYKVLTGPYMDKEVGDFLTFSDAAGGIAFQKIESVGGDDAFLARLSADYGNTVNEAGVKFIADTLFTPGKVLRVKAKVSTNGKNNNFFVKEVVSGGSAPVAAPAPAAASPVAAPAANAYASPPSVPAPLAANPNLPV